MVPEYHMLDCVLLVIRGLVLPGVYDNGELRGATARWLLRVVTIRGVASMNLTSVLIRMIWSVCENPFSPLREHLGSRQTILGRWTVVGYLFRSATREKLLSFKQ